MDTPTGRQTIIVKTPLSSDGKDSFTTEISTQWTVRQLKECLARDLPKKPVADDLKLIFSGSVLTDALLLKDCFRTVAPGCCPVVHLVCKPTISSASRTAPGSVPDARPSLSEMEGLHRRNVPESSSTTPSASFNAWMSSPQMATPTYDPVQMTQYYQTYQAYLQQYMYSQMSMSPMMIPQMNVARTPHGIPHTGGMGANLLRMNQPVGEFGMPNNAVPEMVGGGVGAAGAGGAANPQVVMNAQGGAAVADDEVGEQRDAFDRVYIIFRVVALIFAVYFSSSTTRFFSAFTMLSIFLLLNTIRDFRRWRERQQRRNPEENAEVPAPPPVDPQVEPEVPIVAPPAPEAGLFSTVLSLVVGFVTSLVPDVQNAAVV